MPKVYSLKRKKDFQKLLRFGKRLYSPNFVVFCVNSDQIKFAYMVDSKSIPLSSHRNYCKRVIREIVRKNIFARISKPVFIGIRALKDLKGTNFSQNEKELTDLVNKCINLVQVDYKHTN